MAAAGSQHLVPNTLLQQSVTKPPQALITVVLALLCAGILVLFTDAELLLVRWINCGPIATDAQKNSRICR